MYVLLSEQATGQTLLTTQDADPGWSVGPEIDFLFHLSPDTDFEVDWFSLNDWSAERSVDVGGVVVDPIGGPLTAARLATWSQFHDELRAILSAVESRRPASPSAYDDEMPSGQPFSIIYLVNHDIYGQPAYPALIARKTRVPMRVDSELRVAWVIDNLVVAPHDRFVQVVDARREAAGWTLTLGSMPDVSKAERRIQIKTSGTTRAITLDGKGLMLEKGIEGDEFVRCRLTGRNVRRITIAK